MKKSRLLGAVRACLRCLLSLPARAAVVPSQGTWVSTPQGRDLDGNMATFEVYYDTTLDITWLVDANYAMTSGYDSDGLMNRVAATTWANNLTLGGYDDRRLPGRRL